MVDEPSMATRHAAVRALGKSRDARAVPSLIRVLVTDTSVDGEIRVAAVANLAAIGDRRAVEPLLGALADPADIVRDAAAAALGDLGDDRAIEPLIPCFADRAFFVRSTASRALTRLTGEDFGVDQAKWRAWWEKNKTNLHMQ
jgi:HEAT repeat protein